MGSELQTKYQKLAQEYAKLRAQVDVLKQAVKNEQKSKVTLEEELRTKDQLLRKHAQENDSLMFRNQQLSKRVSLLQDELDSSAKYKKRKEAVGNTSFTSEVQNEELAAKIAENEQLHSKIYEITQKSQKSILQLKEKIATLEQDVLNNDALISEITQKNSLKCDQMEQENVFLQGKLEKVMEDFQQFQLYNSTQNATVNLDSVFSDSMPHNLKVLNVSNADIKNSTSDLFIALRAFKATLLSFLQHFTSFLSYLKERCVIHVMDTTTTSINIPAVNEKLTESIQSLVSLINAFSLSLDNYYLSSAKTTIIDYTVINNFYVSLKALSSHTETFVVYLQIRLNFEYSDTTYGSDLLEINKLIAVSFKKLPKLMYSFADYIEVLFKKNPCNSHITFILEKLKEWTQSLHESLVETANQINSKITQEYQLPSTPQKLKTVNECLISSFSQISATSLEVVEFLNQHMNLLSSVLSQTSEPNSETVPNVLTSSLRNRATAYHAKLFIDSPCQTVPHQVAIHQSKDFGDINDGYQSLLQKISVLQNQLATVTEEKEQLSMHLQLLKVKYEKELKKKHEVQQIEEYYVTDVNDVNAADTFLVHHFTTRISQLNSQLQDGYGKIVFLQSQCNALAKQLSQASALKTNYSHDLESARESIHQLQDQMMTMSSSYESQLSAMSDHLCEVQDKLTKKEEEMEFFKKGKKKSGKVKS